VEQQSSIFYVVVFVVGCSCGWLSLWLVVLVVGCPCGWLLSRLVVLVVVVVWLVVMRVSKYE
jgi:uncharacterized membrane protein